MLRIVLCGSSYSCWEILILAVNGIDSIEDCVAVVEIIRHHLHWNPLMYTEFSEFFFFIKEFLHYKGILLRVFFLKNKI